MKILLIISILLLIAGIGQSDDLLFFADDHYKSLGQPSLVATVANPALQPGECVLEIDLANAGELQELILINQSGSEEDILQEMNEELKSCDAGNINVVLRGSGTVVVTSGPQHLDNLPAGEKASLYLASDQMSLHPAGMSWSWMWHMRGRRMSAQKIKRSFPSMRPRGRTSQLGYLCPEWVNP